MTPDIINLEPVAADTEENLTKGQRVERWLKERWEFRYNDVKNVSEYRPKDKATWFALDDYFLNSCKRALRDEWYWQIESADPESGETNRKKKYLNTSVAELQQTIESTFSPRIDVIKDWLQKLHWQNYDGTAIDQLIETVQLADWYGPIEQGYWKKYLTNWLVATVANALEDHKCSNQVCLVLVGAQGIQKGFWIEHLVQDALGPEYIRTDGNYDPKQKDCKAAIGTYWVIHLDDMLKGLNLKDADAIKHIITAPDVKVRLPYNRKDTWLPHRASFIATENTKEFITDPTGARRFMPFEVERIDWEKYKAINKTELWTHAMSLYQQHKANGTVYYDNLEQERELQTYKEHFAVEFTEEGLLQRYFRPFIPGKDWMQDVTKGNPGEGGKQGVYLTATDILMEMTENAGVFRNLSDKKLGNLLKKHGFQQKQKWRSEEKRAVRAYQVVRLSEKDREIMGDETEMEQKVEKNQKPKQSKQMGIDIDKEADPLA
jgi:hypothetical protein